MQGGMGVILKKTQQHTHKKPKHWRGVWIKPVCGMVVKALCWEMKEKMTQAPFRQTQVFRFLGECSSYCANVEGLFLWDLPSDTHTPGHYGAYCAYSVYVFILMRPQHKVRV